ncbi:aldose epimerase family protein [Corynebacterium atypicum]|uniref:aldose epimerase family protein n=1 Tax=Corynebacterium atypicum TaxID=191610 RepID=UPI00069213B5|nr:hypothetical protein [Corynebacterium atypicum]
MTANHIPEFRIATGETVAVISAAAAAIRSLSWRGRPLVRAFERDTFPPECAGEVLAPWPNRVADGRFRFAGTDYQLELTEPERGNALHGFTSGQLFEPVAGPGTTADRVTLAATLGPRPGWPWPIEVRAEYRVVANGLLARLTATNLASAPAPVALGAHTYLDAQGAPLDECTLCHDFALHQPLDERLIPTGHPVPLAEPGPWQMAGRVLDDSFRRDPGSAKRGRARLIAPDGRGVELDFSARCRWVQVFTSPGRQLAVEPMTAPPNALASGLDLEVLKPHESWGFDFAVSAFENSFPTPVN